MGGSLIYMMLCWQIPKLFSSVLGGAPALTGGDLVAAGTAVVGAGLAAASLGAGAVAAAAGAGAAAGGSALAGTSAAAGAGGWRFISRECGFVCGCSVQFRGAHLGSRRQRRLLPEPELSSSPPGEFRWRQLPASVLAGRAGVAP